MAPPQVGVDTVALLRLEELRRKDAPKVPDSKDLSTMTTSRGNGTEEDNKSHPQQRFRRRWMMASLILAATPFAFFSLGQYTPGFVEAFALTRMANLLLVLACPILLYWVVKNYKYSQKKKSDNPNSALDIPLLQEEKQPQETFGGIAYELDLEVALKTTDLPLPTENVFLMGDPVLVVGLNSEQGRATFERPESWAGGPPGLERRSPSVEFSSSDEEEEEEEDDISIPELAASHFVLLDEEGSVPGLVASYFDNYSSDEDVGMPPLLLRDLHRANSISSSSSDDDSDSSDEDEMPPGLPPLLLRDRNRHNNSSSSSSDDDSDNSAPPPALASHGIPNTMSSDSSEDDAMPRRRTARRTTRRA